MFHRCERSRNFLFKKKGGAGAAGHKQPPFPSRRPLAGHLRQRHETGAGGTGAEMRLRRSRKTPSSQPGLFSKQKLTILWVATKHGVPASPVAQDSRRFRKATSTGGSRVRNGPVGSPASWFGTRERPGIGTGMWRGKGSHQERCGPGHGLEPQRKLRLRRKCCRRRGLAN